MLAKPVIEDINGFKVVRDDYLPGGTKRRVIQPMLEASDSQEFVYASPAFGYAQLALAVSARALGKRATVFTAKRNEPHPMTKAAQQAGATIHMVPYGYLSNVQAKARRYARETASEYVPFGVDTEEALQALSNVARLLDVSPAQVWTVSGSGTLTRALQRAWPEAEFHTVLVGARGRDVGKAKMWEAPEKFQNPAKEPPPWDSSVYYDAKAWRFFREIAQPGALFWNVGA